MVTVVQGQCHTYILQFHIMEEIFENMCLDNDGPRPHWCCQPNPQSKTIF